MRNFHKLRGYGALSYPKHIIATDTETTTIQPHEERHEPKLIVGTAVYMHLSKTLEIVEYKRYVYYTVEDFWGWVDTKCVYNSELYMFAHNWGFDFPVLHGFDMLKHRNYAITTLVDESPPVILTFKRPGHKITVLDTLNYYREKLKSIGDAVGLKKMDIDLNECTPQQLLTYCMRDTEIVAKSVVELCRFLHSNSLSRLTPTVASLALSTFTTRFMSHDIMIDGDEHRVRMGRRSYFGGRTECFRIGRYEGNYYLIDVNSQYPHVMRNHDYPTKAFTVIKTARVDELDVYTRKYCVTAHVTLDTSVPAYPYRINGRTCFPVGQFRTYLSTPEIIYALETDSIVEVHEIVLYEKARIFQDYVDYFYTWRQEYRRRGNKTYANLCKKLLNSLYGKFGQNGHKWEPTQITPRGAPGSWEVYDRPTDKVIKYKEINEVVFESCTDEESTNSSPAIAAHVTAEGRILMQRMIDFLGREHVYYCDTDSLLIDGEAYRRVKSRLSPTVLGCWSLDGEYSKIHIYGLKDYEFGDRIKIKGISKRAVRVSTGVYDQVQFSSLKAAINRGHINTPVLKNVRKELKRLYSKGNVQPDGLVEPFRL